MERYDAQLTPCKSEGEALAYISGQVAPSERERIEAHIAGCEKCCQAIASFARLIAVEESADESRLIETVYDRTAAAARALVTSPAAAVRPASARRRPSWWPSELLVWLQAGRRLAIAASVAALFIAGLIGLAIWSARPGADENIARGFNALREATREVRPSELRITGLDYAPFHEVRGGEPAADTGKIEAARAAFAAAVAKNPTPEARHGLGRALIAAADFNGAVAELERASNEAPDDTGILTDLAVAYSARGDWDSASKDLNRALEIDPSRIEAIFNRALVYQWMKQNEKARADWERYLAADSSSKWAEEARSNLMKLKQNNY